MGLAPPKHSETMNSIVAVLQNEGENGVVDTNRVITEDEGGRSQSVANIT